MRAVLTKRLGLVMALLGVLAAGAQAGQNLNHNETLVKAVGLALGLSKLVPAIGHAGRSLNHNETLLR